MFPIQTAVSPISYPISTRLSPLTPRTKTVRFAHSTPYSRPTGYPTPLPLCVRTEATPASPLFNFTKTSPKIHSPQFDAENVKPYIEPISPPLPACPPISHHFPAFRPLPPHLYNPLGSPFLPATRAYRTEFLPTSLRHQLSPSPSASTTSSPRPSGLQPPREFSTTANTSHTSTASLPKLKAETPSVPSPVLQQVNKTLNQVLVILILELV